MNARFRTVLATATILSGIVSAAHAQTRPMTFLDMQHMRTAGAETPSPDGQWLLYTVAEPDWDEAERQWLLFWSSTIPGKFPETAETGDDGYNHRIYLSTTKDFLEFTGRTPQQYLQETVELANIIEKPKEKRIEW